MATYFFKLLGGFGDRAEVDLDLDLDLKVSQVKELVKNAFKIVPSMKIDLMVGGRKLDDDITWGVVDAKPVKTTILVIGHR